MEFDIIEQNDLYKQNLRNLPEVKNLTSEIEVQNVNSIIQFGQTASENISKISDELLSSMKKIKNEEASEMLIALTKVMDKFDSKELTEPEKKQSSGIFGKIFKNAQGTVDKLFQKYDTMGHEVEKIYVLLKKYESEIKEANDKLKKLYDGNLMYFKELEKYIVAGELASEEVDNYIIQFTNDTNISQEEKDMMTQKLQVCKEMLAQRIYDLKVAENVALQAAPMIQSMQMSNFNLMRKINSSFIITLPIFKQCLAQAIMLKKQEIQAKSLKQLDDKTNELLIRNAQNTASQSVKIAKLASGSIVSIETLETTYETIKKGIEETIAIQSENSLKRKENSLKLEQIKSDFRKKL